MANLTVTVPDDEMADFALAIGADDADTLAKQKTAGSAWLTNHARDSLWSYQRNLAALAAGEAVPDPMPEEG